MQSVSAPLGGSRLLLTKAFQKGCSKQQISKPSTLRYSKAAGWGELAHAARCSSRRIQEKFSLDVARNGVRKSRSGLRAAAETAETSVAETSAPTDTASVTISMQKEAEYGFQIAVVGSDAALGDWNPAQAAVLHWSEGHIWSKTLDLPTNATIEYKFILVNNNMEVVEWQPGENRILATSAGDGTVQGQWDEATWSESEDSPMDPLMSEDDVSDEGLADGGGEEGASSEAATGEKTGAGTKEKKQAPGGDDASADKKVEDAEPSAESTAPENGLRLALGLRRAPLRSLGAKELEQLTIRSAAGPHTEVIATPPTSQVSAASKTCIDCGWRKLLVDFRKCNSYPDGRTDTCRACMAVLAAMRFSKELGHLALSPEAAWMQSKRCSKCGLMKELRDFPKARSHDTGVHSGCRSCLSNNATKNIPSDVPKQCLGCRLVKPASEFRVYPSSSDGRQSKCKSCAKEIDRIQREKARASRVYLKRQQKICTKCKEVKGSSEFHRNRASRDGLDQLCRVCRNEKQREWRRQKKGASERTSSSQ